MEAQRRFDGQTLSNLLHDGGTPAAADRHAPPAGDGSPVHQMQRRIERAALRSFFSPAAPQRRVRTVGGQIAIIVAVSALCWLAIAGVGLAITG